jgi:hypothetical protein
MTKDFSGLLIEVAPAIPSLEPTLSGACADPMPVPAASTMADRRNRTIGLYKDLDPDAMCSDRTADYLGVSD